MPDKFEFILPWPYKSLNPNARVHYAKRAQKAEIYRYTCRLLALETIQKGGYELQPLRDLVESGQQIHVFLDFYPPNRRPRDDDNIIAAFKSGRDGLADALQIDDQHFRTHPYLHRDEIVRPGGEVRVVVTGNGPEA